MEAYKNVYFHKLDVYKRVFKKGLKTADSMEKVYRRPEEISELFGNIIGNKLKNNCITIDDGNKKSILEIVSHDENYIFAKICREKDVISYQIRDMTTFVPNKIDISINQNFEVFTYLLIDRENFVISYLKEQSAPDIKTIQYLIDNNYGQMELFGEISGIMIEDAIPLLKKKDLLGTLTYKMLIPSEKLTNIDMLGLSEKEFRLLKNQKHAEIQVKLVAERNKNAFKDSDAVENVLRKVLSFTKKASIRAKDENGYMQTYNILDSQLTKKVKFDFNRNVDNLDKEIEVQLKSTYGSNKREIVEYIGEQ
ncbi:hypothetical protein [Caldifermentibacillus hisashii]|uniref:hypothetical protein n=1 Tax=Caldifermentibacillus hisashii TaxID=996558 RepID=UPI0031B699C4